MRGVLKKLGVIPVVVTVITAVGCVTRLADIGSGEGNPACSGSLCYAQGSSRFEEYQNERIGEIEHKSGGYRLPSAPVAKLTGERSEYVALLIHGLNDSAYYMADLAEVLAAHGINALTVLLPGHGTFARDTLNVKAEDWMREVQRGVDMASLLGDKLLLGGFSLGAALAMETVLRNGGGVHGLFLFSPAFELQTKIGPWTCLPIVRSRFLETDLARNPVKYTNRYGNGVCQLHRIIKSNRRTSAVASAATHSPANAIQAIAAQIDVPTLLALTYGDIRITPESVLDFSNNLRGPTTLVTYGAPEDLPVILANGGAIKKLSHELLPHSHLLRRTNEYNEQFNPFFEEFEQEFSAFIREHFQ